MIPPPIGGGSHELALVCINWGQMVDQSSDMTIDSIIIINIVLIGVFISIFLKSTQSAAGLKALKPATNGPLLNVQIITLLLHRSTFILPDSKVHAGPLRVSVIHGTLTWTKGKKKKKERKTERKTDCLCKKGSQNSDLGACTAQQASVCSLFFHICVWSSVGMFLYRRVFVYVGVTLFSTTLAGINRFEVPVHAKGEPSTSRTGGRKTAPSSYVKRFTKSYRWKTRSGCFPRSKCYPIKYFLSKRQIFWFEASDAKEGELSAAKKKKCKKNMDGFSLALSLSFTKQTTQKYLMPVTDGDFFFF